MADNWTMLLVHPFKLNPSIFFMSGNPDWTHVVIFVDRVLEVISFT
jgi:hypothetical protein